MANPVIIIGAAVRIFHDQDSFDEGEVKSVAEGQIDVDFYDWIERWSGPHEFHLDFIWIEGKDVLVPLTAGTVVMDFRS